MRCISRSSAKYTCSLALVPSMMQVLLNYPTFDAG
jgi:hypothetical protein